MNGEYKHLIVVGIDGAGGFIKDADTPCFDRIFKDGAVTYKALASFPSVSAECWGSMLIGVSPAVHGLTNDIVASRPYSLDASFPTLFYRIREKMPDAVLGAFCDWSPIATGICEEGICVTKASANDTALTPRITEYIEKNKPTFLFIQMDSADGAGHTNGYGTPAHLQRIHEVDSLLGRIYDSVCRAGINDDTLFCVISDHGGTCDPRGDGTFSGSHGGWTVNERLTTFAATGKTVRSGKIEKMNVRDLAAIVLYALGLPVPEYDIEGWTSQLPPGLFSDSPHVAYRDISGENGAPPRVSDKPHSTKPIA